MSLCYYEVVKDSGYIDYEAKPSGELRPHTAKGDIVLLHEKSGDWGLFENLTCPTHGKLVGCKMGRLQQVSEQVAKGLLKQQGIPLR